MAIPRTRALIGAAAVAVLAISTVGTASPPKNWAAKLPGCANSRVAVAHRANGNVLHRQPSDVVVACGTTTGWPTVEQKIEVFNDNAVLFQPALQGGKYDSGAGDVPGNGNEFGYVVSANGGKAWKPGSIHVTLDDHVFDAQVDNNIYVDHRTNRLFWYMQDSGTGTPHNPYQCGEGRGATIAYSSNEGKAWRWGFDLDHDCAENPDVITARPTINGEYLSYPDVVYLCGDDASTGVATLGSLGRSCSKSLDGGATYRGTTFDDPLGAKQGYYSGPQLDQTHPYPQCAGQSTSAGSHVQPLPNGALVVIVACGTKSYLSESTDEGATWHITHQIPFQDGGAIGGAFLRADSQGNLYVVDKATDSKGHDALLLIHSTDGGKAWSRPLNMTAPGVTSIGTWWFAQGTFSRHLVGDMAIAYYGIDPKSPDGKKGYDDGYITATQNALSRNPLFWSGVVNPQGKPLLYNTNTDGNIGITVLDFNGGAWSPDGQSVWGSWVQDCGTNVTTSPNCVKRYPHYNPGTPETGYAGRLIWPASNAHHQ